MRRAACPLSPPPPAPRARGLTPLAASTIDRELLKPNSSVALHKHSHSVVDTIPAEADSSVQSLAMTEKPDVTYEVRRARRGGGGGVR